MHRQIFLQKLSPAIVAVAVLSTVAAASSEPTAAITKPMVFAQAGSTGGTIGKQDKSASGGEVPARARRAPVRKRHVPVRVRRVPARQHHVSEAAPARASCRKIVGTWLWPFGAEVAFGQYGSLRYTNFLGIVTGKWTCANGIVITAWNNGNFDRITISRDGNSLTSASNVGTFAATRK